MSFLCPKCRRELTNRRKPICSYCGSPISADLRLPDSAAAKIDRLKAEEAKRHRDFMDHDDFPGGSSDGVSGLPGSP